ncbi:hypothetical protein ABW19_dt0209924 [Dactylella cylindrospora]|nr:hypothetical protein ABW19_dt0209924 [Dactylella cylindrospora]
MSGQATSSNFTASTGVSSSTAGPSAAAAGSGSSTYKSRQYTHLQSQLAQLQANLSDMEELLRMTATQAENIKILGGLQGGLFMGATKVFEDGENQRRGPDSQ